MSFFRSRTLVVLAACALALAACNAGRQSSFAPSSSSDATAALADGGLLNVAGEYAGRVAGGSSGNGRARASISESGSSVGGPIAYTFASGKRVNAAAATLESDGSLHGTMVATVGSAACTFRFSATYDTSTHKMSGSYRAVNRCPGESGTFSLDEKCYYDLRAGVRDGDARRDIGGLMRC